MPSCVSFPLGYSVVLAAECLEAIDKVSEEVVHNDLLVNWLTFAICTKSNLFILVSTGCHWEGEDWRGGGEEGGRDPSSYGNEPCGSSSGGEGVERASGRNLCIDPDLLANTKFPIASQRVGHLWLIDSYWGNGGKDELAPGTGGRGGLTWGVHWEFVESF